MKGRRGALFIEIMVVLVIAALLMAAYLGLMKKSPVGGGDAQSTPKAAINKAKGVECASKLSQIRAALEMKYAEDGRYPTVQEAGTVGPCPVSGKPYVYDPRTGRVKCSTPGHETF